MTYENKNYIENASDILHDHPNLVHAIVNVYNCGYIDGIKKGKRIALKDTKFEVIRNLRNHVRILLDRNAVLSEMYNNSLSSKESQ